MSEDEKEEKRSVGLRDVISAWALFAVMILVTVLLSGLAPIS